MCARAGYPLLAQASLDLNNLLSTAFFLCGKHFCWIGAKKDTAHDGEWVWVDRTPNANLHCGGRLWGSIGGCVYVRARGGAGAGIVGSLTWATCYEDVSAPPFARVRTRLLLVPQGPQGDPRRADTCGEGGRVPRILHVLAWPVLVRGGVAVPRGTLLPPGHQVNGVACVRAPCHRSSRFVMAWSAGLLLRW